MNFPAYVRIGKCEICKESESSTAMIAIDDGSFEKNGIELIDPAKDWKKNWTHGHVDRFVFLKNFCIGKRVLDVGCGFGYGSKIISGCAKEVVGVDINEKMVLFAKRYNSAPNLNYLCQDIADFVDKLGFEIILCLEVLEHLTDEQIHSLLPKLSNLLIPKGVLIASTPCVKTTGKTGNPHHVREFSHRDFTALLGRYFVLQGAIFYDWAEVSFSTTCDFEKLGNSHHGRLVVQHIFCSRKESSYNFK
jgi:2-polyprenyl-3-methyl-5-hydroxy-6-metoxy-1,4-benzoquinol methylase